MVLDPISLTFILAPVLVVFVLIKVVVVVHSCLGPFTLTVTEKMLIRLALVGLLELTCLYNALVKVEKGGEGRGQKKKKKKIFFLERPPPSRFRVLRSPLLEDDRDPKSHHEQGGGLKVGNKVLARACTGNRVVFTN